MTIPLPRSGWSVLAWHDLLYVIRAHQELDDAATQGAMAARNGNIRAGFGCEGRVSGGVDEVVEVHRCRHGVLFPHPQPIGLQAP